MYLTQGLKRSIQIKPNVRATLDGGREHTWREIGDRIAKLAAAMHGLGLETGDRAAILALNSDRYFEFLYATVWAGGVFVPVNTRLAAPEVAFWLKDSESTLLFVDANFAPMVAELSAAGQIPAVTQIVYMGDDAPPDGMHDYEALLKAADPVGDAERGYEDLAGIFYTGGTTGRSKGVMLSHRNLVFNGFNCIPALDFREDALWLHAAPMFHIADCLAIFGLTQVAATHIFIPGFSPDGVLDAFETHHITDTLLVPTMINMVVNHPGIETRDLSSLRNIAYGASPMPEAVVIRALEIIPQCKFRHAYGQTECAPLSTLNGPEAHVVEGPMAFKFRSAGRAALGVEIRIVDEDGVEVPRGEVGEIAVRGPNVMQGYWRQPELTAAALRDGWMHSGDGGRMDEDGYVYVVDRMKDMIITGGENVYSAEVEDAVHGHAAVAECAVIGIPDDKWGERVHAIVRLKDGQTVSADAIMTHCHTLIAGFKCPRSVDFRTDPLPLSGAGKILKTVLRKPYWEGHDKQVS
ncbi:MAG: long-chain-fatty-acid--CoA ligase [Alphaproteobacteria bacterium]